MASSRTAVTALGGPARLRELDGAQHGLAVGDDGKRFLRGLGQTARLFALFGHQEGEVGGGLQPPATGYLDQLDPPALILFAQGADGGGRIGALGQATGEVRFAERLGGGEQQGLDATLDMVAHRVASGRPVRTFR